MVSCILLPTSTQTKPQGGKVVTMGEGRTIGKTKIGIQVVYSKYTGKEVEFDRFSHLILKEDDIVAILDTDDVRDVKPWTDRVLIKVVKKIEPASKRQLVISSALMTVGIAIITWTCLPSSLTIFNFCSQKVVNNWQFFLCVAVSLWVRLIIGFDTEYFTSNSYSPVKDVDDSCRTSAATNVIFSLALEYKSVIIPIFAIAVCIYVSFSFAAMYGIALVALGMLSIIASGQGNILPQKHKCQTQAHNNQDLLRTCSERSLYR